MYVIMHSYADADYNRAKPSRSPEGGTYDLSVLSPDSAYKFRVVALEGAVPGTWTQDYYFFANPAAPGQVTGVSATSSGSTEVTVSWTAPERAGGYTIRWRDSLQGWDSTREASLAGTEYIITDLTTNVLQNIQVRAISGDLTGTWSAVAYGTPIVPQ